MTCNAFSTIFDGHFPIDHSINDRLDLIEDFGRAIQEVVRFHQPEAQKVYRHWIEGVVNDEIFSVRWCWRTFLVKWSVVISLPKSRKGMRASFWLIEQQLNVVSRFIMFWNHPKYLSTSFVWCAAEKILWWTFRIEWNLRCPWKGMTRLVLYHLQCILRRIDLLEGRFFWSLDQRVVIRVLNCICDQGTSNTVSVSPHASNLCSRQTTPNPFLFRQNIHTIRSNASRMIVLKWNSRWLLLRGLGMYQNQNLVLSIGFESWFWTTIAGIARFGIDSIGIDRCQCIERYWYWLYWYWQYWWYWWSWYW